MCMRMSLSPTFLLSHPLMLLPLILMLEEEQDHGDNPDVQLIFQYMFVFQYPTDNKYLKIVFISQYTSATYI